MMPALQRLPHPRVRVRSLIYESGSRGYRDTLSGLCRPERGVEWLSYMYPQEGGAGRRPRCRITARRRTLVLASCLTGPLSLSWPAHAGRSCSEEGSDFRRQKRSVVDLHFVDESRELIRLLARVPADCQRAGIGYRADNRARGDGLPQ